MERAWLLKHETSKFVDYERIELIRQENRDQLIEDLEERTGIKKINRVEIGAINFIRDTVNIKIFYFAKDDVIFNKDTNQRNKDSLS